MKPSTKKYTSRGNKPRFRRDELLHQIKLALYAGGVELVASFLFACFLALPYLALRSFFTVIENGYGPFFDLNGNPYWEVTSTWKVFVVGAWWIFRVWLLVLLVYGIVHSFTLGRLLLGDQPLFGEKLAEEWKRNFPVNSWTRCLAGLVLLPAVILVWCWAPQSSAGRWTLSPEALVTPEKSFSWQDLSEVQLVHKISHETIGRVGANLYQSSREIRAVTLRLKYKSGQVEEVPGVFAMGILRFQPGWDFWNLWKKDSEREQIWTQSLARFAPGVTFRSQANVPFDTGHSEGSLAAVIERLPSDLWPREGADPGQFAAANEWYKKFLDAFPDRHKQAGMTLEVTDVFIIPQSIPPSPGQPEVALAPRVEINNEGDTGPARLFRLKALGREWPARISSDERNRLSVTSIDKDKAAGVRLDELKDKPMDLTFKVWGIRFEEAGGAYNLHIMVNGVQIKGLSK